MTDRLRSFWMSIFYKIPKMGRQEVMIIDHVKVFTEALQKFTDGGIVIKDGTIEQVYTEGNRPQTEDEVLDGKGMYAIPGLIDLHFHGCKGA